jgi:hypothetical protein
VEAVAWSLFGLFGVGLGILVTAYWRLAGRIEEVRRELGDRIDGVHNSLGNRIDGVQNSLGSRIDALNARMDTHMGRHLG